MNAYPVLLQAHPECRPWQVRLFGLTLGLVTGADFVAVSMMGVAGAAIQGGVAAAPQEYLWALTSFAVGAVLVNLLLGRFATLISYRRYTQWALLLFMAGSVGCALAEDITSLALARLLQERGRNQDSVYRLGGEEFVLLLPGCELAAAQQQCQQLLALVQPLVEWLGHDAVADP